MNRTKKLTKKEEVKLIGGKNKGVVKKYKLVDLYLVSLV